MKDTFADTLRDLRTEFENLDRPDKEPLPEASKCFDAATKSTEIINRVHSLAIKADCRGKLDGPFCDQVEELDGDLQSARRELLTVGIQMAKTEGFNVEVIERLVTEAGGNPILVAQTPKISVLT